MSFRPMTSAAALMFCAGMAQADYSLTILHTNDFHARFEPISKYDSGCSAEDNQAGECFGGTARLVSAIADARACPLACPFSEASVHVASCDRDA